jgi:hypothetical protein
MDTSGLTLGSTPADAAAAPWAEHRHAFRSAGVWPETRGRRAPGTPHRALLSLTMKPHEQYHIEPEVLSPTPVVNAAAVVWARRAGGARGGGWGRCTERVHRPSPLQRHRIWGAVCAP